MPECCTQTAHLLVSLLTSLSILLSASTILFFFSNYDEFLKTKPALCCLSTGDSGKSVGHHLFRKQRSGLRPSIWTCGLSCRVR